MHSWTLFGTLGCHLCDQAELILLQLQKEFPISFDKSDVACCEAQVTQYGDRIPVLRNNFTGQEIDWPFASEKIAQWLEHDAKSACSLGNSLKNDDN